MGCLGGLREEKERVGHGAVVVGAEAVRSRLWIGEDQHDSCDVAGERKNIDGETRLLQRKFDDVCPVWSSIVGSRDENTARSQVREPPRANAELTKRKSKTRSVTSVNNDSMHLPDPNAFSILVRLGFYFFVCC